MRSTMRAALAVALAASAVSGCYVVPVAPDGTVAYGSPVLAVPAPYPAVPPARAPFPPVYAGPAAPSVLTARLYPANDAATTSGMLAGTVVNQAGGKARFELAYRGETLVGEATRLAGNTRSGIANAYGDQGTYMTCAYTMSTPTQGVGTCNLSNGARYQVHLGG